MNRIKYLLFIVLLSMPMMVFADEYVENVGDNFCGEPETLTAMRLIGYILFFAKILIPIIIIVIGTLDYYKAVTSDKPQEEVKKQSQRLMKRLIIGLLVFFVPSIINVFLTFVSGWSSEYDAEYKKCSDCLLKPLECDIPSN